MRSNLNVSMAWIHPYLHIFTNYFLIICSCFCNTQSKSEDYSSSVNVYKCLLIIYSLYGHWTFSYCNVCVKGG